MQLKRSEIRGSINLSSLSPLHLQILRLEDLKGWTNAMTVVSKTKSFRVNGQLKYYTNKDIMQGIKTLVRLRLLERQ